MHSDFVSRYATPCRLLLLAASICLFTACEKHSVMSLVPEDLKPFVKDVQHNPDAKSLSIKLTNGETLLFAEGSFGESGTINGQAAFTLSMLALSAPENQLNIATILNNIAPRPTSCGS